MKFQVLAGVLCLASLLFSPPGGAQSAEPLAAEPHRAEQARTLYRANESDALVELARAWVAEQPRDAQAHFFLGAGLRDRSPRDALAALKTSEGLGLKSMNLAFELGQVYQLLQRYDESAIYLKRALEVDREGGETHKQLAITYAMAGKYPAALPHFEKAVKKGDDSLHTLYSYGVTALEAGKPALSERLLAEVVRRDPGYDGAAQTLGIIYFDAGDFQRAEQVYLAALPHLPGSAPLLGNLANAQRRLGRVDDALGSARKSVSLDPAFANGWENLALAQSRAGQLDDARASAKKAVELDPGEASRWEVLARVEHLAGDTAARDAAMERLRSVSPKAAQALRKRRYQGD